jgi:heptosyltransferase-2
MNSTRTPSGTPGKILIIRLSSIGDIILSTPFIRLIRNRFPEAKIDFVVKGIYKDLLEFNPHIDQLYKISLNGGRSELSDLRQILKSNAYDVIFDLHNNLRSNFLKRRIGNTEAHSINKEKFKQTLLVWFKLNLYKKEITIPERYLAVANSFGVTDDGKGLDLYWESERQRSADNKAILCGINLDKPIIGLAPGAGFFTKRWPAYKFKNLIQLIQRQKDIQIVIFGGNEDREIGNRLSKEDNVFDLCGKLSLLESAALMSKSKIVVTNDTGLMHMTAAVKTPVIAIFGSTVRELGFFPYRAEGTVIENTNLSCRPCSHIGRHKCPKGHFKCMEDISAEEVYNVFDQLIKAKSEK